MSCFPELDALIAEQPPESIPKRGRRAGSKGPFGPRGPYAPKRAARLEAKAAEMRAKYGPDQPEQSAGTGRRFWSERELGRLAKLYPTRPTKEVAAELHRTVRAVYKTAQGLGLKKSQEFLNSELSYRLRKGSTIGQAHQFQKGHVPVNKGVRTPGYHAGRMQETQFKKGEKSHTWKPLGTILKDSEGYLRIKVRERQPQDSHGWNPEIWPCVHHQVWREHKGPIPPKHIVIFKDRNPENCAIENLELISRAELARRNAMWGRYPPELAKTIMTNAALKRQIRRLANGTEQSQRPAGPPV